LFSSKSLPSLTTFENSTSSSKTGDLMLFKLPFEEEDMKRQVIMRMLKSIYGKTVSMFSGDGRSINL
jgi:hypothetical protein